MLTRVEASNYICLQKVDQQLHPLQILIGPNASGKSTFLDVVRFISDVVASGVKAAVSERTENFHDLVWGRDGTSFRLALEANVPSENDGAGLAAHTTTIRYQIQIRIEAEFDQVILDREDLSVFSSDSGNLRPILTRTSNQVKLRAECDNQEFQFTFGPDQSGLANLPMDRTQFPAATRLKDALLTGIQSVVLDNELLRGASPPGQGNVRLFDGLNLPRRVHRLSDTSNDDFNAWISHVQTAIPDLDTIRTVLRPEDKYRYLMLRYKNGLEVPGFMLSDGTLRLLALTLLAYVPESNGMYLIEEPEVGVHPAALETIMQSLSSIYNGQILITTHSPILLAMAKAKDLLCFRNTDHGTEITPGAQHPFLQDCQSKVMLSDLFAAGVLNG